MFAFSKRNDMTTTTYKVVEYTKEQINMLREWVKECYWGNEEDINELSNIELLRFSDKRIDGGISSFNFSN